MFLAKEYPCTSYWYEYNSIRVFNWNVAGFEILLLEDRNPICVIGGYTFILSLFIAIIILFRTKKTNICFTAISCVALFICFVSNKLIDFESIHRTILDWDHAYFGHIEIFLMFLLVLFTCFRGSKPVSLKKE